MIKAWNDLKSFVTVAMIILLFVIVIASLFGATLSENLLILVTNLITAVITYYFSRKSDNKDITQDSETIEEREE